VLINDVNKVVSFVGSPSTPQVAALIVSEEQREVSVVAGETLTIECIATGWPVPEVTWSRYGGQLPRQRHHQLNGRHCLP